MRYQQTRPCDSCGTPTKMCTYHPTGPFRGAWLCHECEGLDTETLADVAGAATRVVSKQAEGQLRGPEAQVEADQ